MRRFIKPALITLGAVAATFMVVSSASFNAAPAAKTKTFCPPPNQGEAQHIPTTLVPINLPTLPSIPQINLPQINCIPLPTLPELPEVQLPTLPTVTLPTVTLPTVTLPTIPVPCFDNPSPADVQAGMVATTFCPPLN